MYFKVQNKSEVMAFSCLAMKLADSWTKLSGYHQGIELLLAKISEYCRRKNKETQEVCAERDLAIKQKELVLKEMDEYIVLSNRR